jgi:hypothetical protein
VARPDVLPSDQEFANLSFPGGFKTVANVAGDTRFVEPALVPGTLR